MKQERFGLMLIASSLIVILAICGLLLETQAEQRRAQNRAQGLNLARLLSSISYERLLPSAGKLGLLQVVKTSQSNPDFAYAAIVNPMGSPVAEVTVPGVIVPPASNANALRGIAQEQGLGIGVDGNKLDPL